ncbi:MAG: YceI family protein [Gemmatimonadota bacterium]
MLSLIAAATLLVAPSALDRAPSDTVTHAAHQATTWQIDQAHSELRFRIRHFVNRISGTFTDWDGTVTGDPGNWGDGSVTVDIRAKSVDTRNERRDNDLRSERFFEVEKYPEVTFTSRSVTVAGSDLTILGDLTIKGTTKAVTLKGSYLGITPGREGKDRVGFEASTTINRLDYGVSWNRTVEGGGVMLGDEVTIEISIEAVKQSS